MHEEPLSADAASVVAAVLMAAAADGPDPDLDSSKSRGTILVVDNDRTLRTLLVRFLALEGYLAFEAPHGLEALAIAKRRREPIDLLLTDVMMPVMSGFELAEAFLSVHPEAKVLYMSGHVYDVPDVGQAAQADPDAFLVKPFWAEQLLERVRAIVPGPAPSGPS